MTDRKQEEQKAIKLEIKARKELLRRLDHPQKLLRAATEKEAQKRKERIEKLTQYKSYQEAQDDYGWGFITEEEFDEVVRIMETGTEEIEKEITPVEVAEHILAEFVGRLMHEIAGLEFDLLSPEEQLRVMERNDAIRARREARHRR